MGDVHPQGNPHYWLDPGNGRRIAKAIADKLSKLDPADAAYFAARSPTSTSGSPRPRSAGTRRWRPTRAQDRDLPPLVAELRRALRARRDRLRRAAAGHPALAEHTLDLIQEMKAQNVKIILVEPYFDLKTPNSIARETGAKVVVMPPSVGGGEGDHGLLHAVRLRRQRCSIAAIKETGAK